MRNHNTNFTTESSLKARETVSEQLEKYRKTYLDDDYWKELAREYGVRMPPYYTRPSDSDIKFWLKLGKVQYTQFVEAYGWKDAAEFEKLNPTHGMKILAGLILELAEENKRLKKLGRERCKEFDLSLGNTESPKIKLYVGKSKLTRRRYENSLR